MGALAWNKRTKSPIADLLHAAYERRAEAAKPGSDDDWRRDHLGASQLGHDCDRFLWLSFRWAVAEQKDGRMLRLLERGKREESWLLDDLRSLGVQIESTQVPVKWGHVGGSADAVLWHVPGAKEEEAHLGEFKTSNAKQFAKLVEQGVKRAKPEHYVQMQVYMHGLGLKWALYIAVCKDSDEIHTERVAYDQKEAEAAVARGLVITLLGEPPARKADSMYAPCLLTSKDGKQWPCRFWNQCWKGGLPEKNCRTCVHVTPKQGGTWRCEKHGADLLPDAQRAGCVHHLSIPAIVGHKVVAVEENQITYQAADGTVVEDGGAA